MRKMREAAEAAEVKVGLANDQVPSYVPGEKASKSRVMPGSQVKATAASTSRLVLGSQTASTSGTSDVQHRTTTSTSTSTSSSNSISTYISTSSSTSCAPVLPVATSAVPAEDHPVEIDVPEDMGQHDAAIRDAVTFLVDDTPQFTGSLGEEQRDFEDEDDESPCCPVVISMINHIESLRQQEQHLMRSSASLRALPASVLLPYNTMVPQAYRLVTGRTTLSGVAGGAMSRMAGVVTSREAERTPNRVLNRVAGAMPTHVVGIVAGAIPRRVAGVVASRMPNRVASALPRRVAGAQVTSPASPPRRQPNRVQPHRRARERVLRNRRIQNNVIQNRRRNRRNTNNLE